MARFRLTPVALGRLWLLVALLPVRGWAHALMLMQHGMVSVASVASADGSAPGSTRAAVPVLPPCHAALAADPTPEAASADPAAGPGAEPSDESAAPANAGPGPACAWCELCQLVAMSLPEATAPGPVMVAVAPLPPTALEPEPAPRDGPFRPPR